MNTTTTLGDFVESTMSKYADRPAYQCAGQQITFAELEIKSRQVAYWLQSKFNQGDRVAVQLPNINQYPIAALGILRAGMVVVNTNPLYTPREMEHQFKDSGAKAIFILAPLLPQLDKIIKHTDLEAVVAVDPADLVKEPVTLENDKVIRFYDVLQNDAHCELAPRTQTDSSEIAMLQYTGGTTGVAKGACLTHHSVLSNVEQVHDRLAKVIDQGKETFVCPLPLYHIYAFAVNMIYMSGMGNLNLLIPNPRDMDAFVKQIKGVPFTGMSGINTLFVGLCNHPEFKELDFSHLRLTVSGGTPLIPDVARVWTETTGCTITEGYGLTETSPVAIFNEPGNEEIGTIGRPVANTIIAIRDASGNDVADGEAGELMIKGPQVMNGYWQRPDATRDTFTKDGFFKTGDVAIKQENGNYRIVDRIKDMILVSGFNVYPTEVEAVIVSHPKVLEAAVVGGVSEKTGEEVLAYITVSGDASEEDIVAHCRENLTAYKIPKKVTIVEALPKSTVGKILRRELRQPG